MFGGAFVVDHYALVFQGFFLARHVRVDPAARSTTSREGDYYQGEFYFLLLASVLGMMRHGARRAT